MSVEAITDTIHEFVDEKWMSLKTQKKQKQTREVRKKLQKLQKGKLE